MNELHFNTLAAANLFLTEISGQISDGAWENTRPLDHWKYWCEAEVKLDGKIGHTGHPMKTNYNLGSLKKHIKDRMLNAVKVTKMPWFDADLLDLGRVLTDPFYIKFTPECLRKLDVSKITPEYEMEQYGFTIESRTRAALKEIGENCSDEFIKMLKKEVISQMVIRDRKHAEMMNDRADTYWARLRAAGIKNEDDLHNAINAVNAKQIDPRELDAALEEIHQMMTTQL